MHYSGMAAMRTSVTIGYDRTTVAASVAIAVVAATVALWFTVTIRRPLALAVSAVIMGVAVSGMHYTGMYAMRVADTVSGNPVSGLLPIALLGPIVVFVIAVIVVLLAALLNRPGDADGDTIRILDGDLAPTAAVPPTQRTRTSASAFIRPVR
jgi:NO-binding membrane sensor protein with MHYT domain